MSESRVRENRTHGSKGGGWTTEHAFESSRLPH